MGKKITDYLAEPAIRALITLAIDRYECIQYTIVYRTDLKDLDLATRVSKAKDAMPFFNKKGTIIGYRFKFPGFRKGQAATSGQFNLTVYPTTGSIIFTPKSPTKDAFAGLLWVMCQELNYTWPEALHLIVKLKLANVEIEAEVLSDPFNSLPIGSEVTNEYPPLDHTDAEKARHSVDESQNLKETTTKGNGKATPMQHEAMWRSANFAEFMREELDYVQGIGEQVSQLRADFNDHAAQVVLTVEDTKYDVRQVKKGFKTLNKDTTEILKRLPADLSEKEETRTKLAQEQLEIQKQQLEAQRETIDRTSAGLEEIRGEIRYGTQEHVEFLQRMMEQHDQYALNLQIYGEGLLQQGRETKQKVDQIDLHLQIYSEGLLQQGREIKQEVELYHKGVIFQTEFFMRRVLELERQLEQIHMEVQGIYRIREEMREIYAKILAILDQVPQLTAAQLAAIFNVKPNKMHYWLKRLRFMHLVDRDRKDPDMDQGKQLSDSHAQKGRIRKRIRKVYHYFLSKLRNHGNISKNEQGINGGEINDRKPT